MPMDPLLLEVSRLLRDNGRRDFRDYVDDSRVAPNELLFDDDRRILLEQAPMPSNRKKPTMGINPVTIRSGRHDDPRLVLCRMHIAAPGGKAIRTVSVMMHHGAQALDETMLAFAMYDEDRLIDGLLHLFPHGELVPGEQKTRDWPRPKPVWETSDGRTWTDPDEAQQHQAKVDAAAESDRVFRPWFVIDYGAQVVVGRMASPDELGTLQRVTALVASTTLHTGFHSKREAEAFAEKRRVHA